MFSFCRSEYWNEQGRCFVETVYIVRTLQNLASPPLGRICTVNQQSRTIRVSKMELLCLWIPAPRSKAQGNRTKGAWFVFPQQDFGGSLAGQAQESRDKCVWVILGKSPRFSDLRFHNLNDLTFYNRKFLLSPCDQFSPSFGEEYTEIRNIRSLLSCLSSNWWEKTNIQGTVNLPSWGVSWAPSTIRGLSKKERWVLVGQSTSTHLAGEEERADTSLNQKQIHQANSS